MPRSLKELSFLLSIPMILCLVFLGCIPLLWPIASENEGKWFPVVRDVNIEIVGLTRVGTIVDVSFYKERSCSPVGILWNKENGERAVVLFPGEWKRNEDNSVEVSQSSDNKISRPVGFQNAGPWLILGITDITKSVVTVVHSCHPFWLTYTHFYP